DGGYRQWAKTMLRRAKKMVRTSMSGYARAMSTSSVARLPRWTAPAALTVSKAHVGTAVLVDKHDLGRRIAGLLCRRLWGHALGVCPCAGSLEDVAHQRKHSSLKAQLIARLGFGHAKSIKHMPQTILFTGASGFIGQTLFFFFKQKTEYDIGQ